MSNIIDKIQLSGVTYDIGGQGGSGVSVVEVTQAGYDALPTSAKTDTSKMYVITDAEAGDLTNYYTKTETNTLLGGKADTATTYTKQEVDNAITAATATKQDTLVSSQNIKTINNESLLGSGNIDIQGGGGVTIDPTLDSGSTNPVANSAITEAVLVPSYRGLIEVEYNIAFPNATALYVENVTSGAYQDATMIEFYLSGVSEVSENILVTSFSGHTFNTEPSYMDYEWTEDNSLIFTPKTSGNYFYKIHNGWDTGFGVYIIDDYSSGSSSSVIQNEIYPRLNNLGERIDSFTDTKVTGTSYNNLYIDYGGYWYHEIEIFDNASGRFTASDKLRYNDFGYDNDGIIFVKKTSGATSGSTDCITSGGVYEQMGGMKIVKLTQSAYDALSPNYDSNTLYVIVN